MQARALLAHDDRADVSAGGSLDDRVDGVADQEFDTLSLEDLGDSSGSFHVATKATATTTFPGGDPLTGFTRFFLRPIPLRFRRHWGCADRFAPYRVSQTFSGGDVPGGATS